MKKIIIITLFSFLATNIHAGEGTWLITQFYKDLGEVIEFNEGVDYHVDNNTTMTFLGIQYSLDFTNWTDAQFNEIDLSNSVFSVGDEVSLRIVNNLFGEITYQYATLEVTYPTPQTPTITNGWSTPVCGLSSQTLSCSSSQYANYYAWSVSGGSIAVGQGTRTIKITPNNSGSNISAQVRAKNVDNEYSPYSNNSSATLNRSIYQTTDVTGPDIITVLSQTQYDISVLNYAIDYQWDIVDNSNAIANSTYTNGNRTLNINWNTGAHGQIHLRARGLSLSCGPGAWGNILNVTVNPQPETPVISGPTSLCQRIDQTNSYSATSTNATTFDWTLNPANAGSISANSTDNITVTWNATYYGNANLSVTASNTFGSEASGPYGINIAESPYTFFISGGDASYCPGTSVNLSTSGHNASIVSGYIWRVISGSGNIMGSGESIYLNLGSDATGTVTVGLKLVGNCGYSTDEITKTINVLELLGAAGDIMGDDFVCDGQSYDFTCSNVDNADSYSWDIDPLSSVISEVENGSTVTYETVAQGFTSAVITATAIGQCGDIKTAGTHTIDKKANPVISSVSGQSTEICKNSTVLYTASGNSSVESWSFSFSNANAFLDTTQVDNQITVDWNSKYIGTDVAIIAQASNGCISVDKIAFITFKDIPNAPLQDGPIGLICESETAIGVALVDNVNIYNWSEQSVNIEMLSSGGTKNSTCTVRYFDTYTGGQDDIYITAQNECGTSTPATIRLTRNNAPHPGSELVIGPENICYGQAGTYTINDLAGADSYTWEIVPSNAGSIIQDGSNSTVFAPDNSSATASLRVRGVNDCGEGLWSEYKIIGIQTTTIAKPLISGHNDYYCYNDTANITAVAVNTIIWEDTQSQTTTQSNILIIDGVKNNSTYYVYSTNQVGCLSEKEEIGLVVKRVIADFSLSDSEIKEGEKIFCTNLSSGADSYKWSFGEGSNNVYTQDPEHYYYMAEQYIVSLEAIYDNKCSDKTEQEITVIELTAIEDNFTNDIRIYPNPAGEFIKIEFKGIVEGHMTVYSVSGKAVIEREIDSKTVDVDLSELKSGVYLMAIKSDGKASVFEFIKAE